ncbi:MAG: gluconate 2-dehydrogenase subunit 3 family protein [Actinobacteria bacterium]|nr:gluconate 2-dehydrogenase subunit 3 family protein [Actinomycetota bacterium]
MRRLGEREREVVAARSAAEPRPLERFGGRLEPPLRALVDRLIPGAPTGVDIAGFIDATVDDPLGRGDRSPGVPERAELFRMGLDALAGEGFADWPEDRQRELIARMRRGDADGDLGWPAKAFTDALLERALTGYLSHPDVWERIGFHGPAYPEGYAWIGPDEAVARHEKQPGWAAL